jgi:arylsulfatase A-like enzyme
MQLFGHIRAYLCSVRHVALVIGSVSLASVASAQQPNIVIINIDDMGWGDFGVYGSDYSQTPNIDQLATKGTRFTQFYTGAPICSPSRAALLTGQYSARSGINSFLDNTTSNLARDNANSLSLATPNIVRAFHDAGYATGHFGKWHLGGGRDVGYAVGTTAGTTVTAPRVVEYGYDQAWTQMEGLGNRIINVVNYGGNANGTTTRPSAYYNGLNQASEARGTGNGQDQLVYLERQFNADFIANRTIQFIDDSRAANPDKPFFINYWPDEVHTVNDPPAVYKNKYNALYPSLPVDQRNYLASLEHVDAQIGRVVDHIDQLGLGDNTLILVTADNGAVLANSNRIGSNGSFRGGKGDVFEGGVREPLIARWTSHVTAGRTDTQTVMWTPDLFPTLTQIAGVATPANAAFDGEVLSQALLGNQSQARSKPLFWNMNRGTENRHSNPNSTGAGANGQEVLGIRNGNWKLLINAQGTAPELYDLATDIGESTNRATHNPSVVNLLSQQALLIRYSTPSRTLPDAVTPLVRLKAQDLAGLGNGAAVSSWSDTATGDSFNGSVSQSTAANRPTLQTSALNGRAVVSFDGGDSLASSITNSLPSSGKGITVIAVATGDTSGGTAQRLGQIGSRAGTSGKIVGLDASSTSTDISNGGAGFRFNNGASLYDTPVASSGFHIVTWQVDDAQSYSDAKLFVDGTLPANTFTGTSTTTNMTSFSGADFELIIGTGRNSSGELLTSDYYTGQLAEFLVFNDVLTIGQINLVANYLSTEYALPFAYETNILSAQAALGGDFNHDGKVDSADYVVWRKTGTGGEQGYQAWRANFGNSVAGLNQSIPDGGLAAAIPEPATWIMIGIAAAFLFSDSRTITRGNSGLNQ